MDMVLMDAQLWWDTPLHVLGKGYNLRGKLNREGNKSQKTVPIFPLARNTTGPQSQVCKATFLAQLQGQDPLPRCCHRTARGALQLSCPPPPKHHMPATP